MISIIVCSIKPQLLSSFSKNVKDTIGVPYEIIATDNTKAKEGICKVYNKGAGEAKYEVLCFAHEDILFYTTDWGIKVIKMLNSQEVGVVGVAGATVKTKTPSPWWISNFFSASDFLRYNVFQARGTEKVIKQEILNPKLESLSEVVLLDGMWLCCRKDTWAETKFDESHFAGFHFYDLDFCLGVKEKGLKNFVTFNIDIEHTSAGNMEVNWIKDSIIFYKKWKKRLPIYIQPEDAEKGKDLEYQAIRNLILVMGTNKFFPAFAIIKFLVKGGRVGFTRKDYYQLYLNILRNISKEDKYD